jgi:hypothetical protein
VKRLQKERRLVTIKAFSAGMMNFAMPEEMDVERLVKVVSSWKGKRLVVIFETAVEGKEAF